MRNNRKALFSSMSRNALPARLTPPSSNVTETYTESMRNWVRRVQYWFWRRIRGLFYSEEFKNKPVCRDDKALLFCFQNDFDHVGKTDAFVAHMKIIAYFLVLQMAGCQCLPAFALDKPMEVPLGSSGAGILLPPADVSAALMLALQVILYLVLALLKKKEVTKKDSFNERVMQQLSELNNRFSRMDEKIKALPKEIELIAMKTARKEIERLK